VPELEPPELAPEPGPGPEPDPGPGSGPGPGPPLLQGPNGAAKEETAERTSMMRRKMMRRRMMRGRRRMWYSRGTLPRRRKVLADIAHHVIVGIQLRGRGFQTY
jgi:hypothetical protein